MVFNYEDNTNKLIQINDGKGANGVEDLDNQTSNTNYDYDLSGFLTKDESE